LVEADPKPIAELRGVSKIYGSGDLAVKALDQLDLIIREGDYLAVMGASGSGKEYGDEYSWLPRPPYSRELSPQ
jgi:putative ABC transport system ATP-binding protein